MSRPLFMSKFTKKNKETKLYKKEKSDKEKIGI